LQLAERLEAAGFFDRVVESFPQTNPFYPGPANNNPPELAVLMAASKIT